MQVAFETIVPEEIVVVKTVHGKWKHKMHKSQAAEAEGDSDEEAQRLIDEAENEQDDDADAATGEANVTFHSHFRVSLSLMLFAMRPCPVAWPPQAKALVGQMLTFYHIYFVKI